MGLALLEETISHPLGKQLILGLLDYAIEDDAYPLLYAVSLIVVDDLPLVKDLPEEQIERLAQSAVGLVFDRCLKTKDDRFGPETFVERLTTELAVVQGSRIATVSDAVDESDESFGAYV